MTKKSILAKSALGKKEELKAAKTPSQICTDELRTPNNILTPPILDFPATPVDRQEDPLSSLANSKKHLEV